MERYAWFSLSEWDRVKTTCLYRDGPTLTPVGEAFRRAG